jgi:DNA-binding transcriptional MocR family regulator
LAAVGQHLPDWQVQRPGGGLNLWCQLPAALSSALVARAGHHDVLLAAGPSFAPEGGLDRFLRIPYSHPAHVLTDAIGRIADAWRETLADPGGGSRATTSLVA